ncbi:integrase core domain-containing protein [Rhizorhabdus sp. FW153]|uniref:integrase core domain-containing protein n=1 Tax=Rhizorhabdus sp. FW153 TaxID=3400216 RepID=UPI003CEE5439
MHGYIVSHPAAVTRAPGRGHYNARGRLMHNGFVESFNDRLRGECLNKTCPSRWLTPGSGAPSRSTATTPSVYIEARPEGSHRIRQPMCLGACPQTRCDSFK